MNNIYTYFIHQTFYLRGCRYSVATKYLVRKKFNARKIAANFHILRMPEIETIGEVSEFCWSVIFLLYDKIFVLTLDHSQAVFKVQTFGFGQMNPITKHTNSCLTAEYPATAGNLFLHIRRSLKIKMRG